MPIKRGKISPGRVLNSLYALIVFLGGVKFTLFPPCVPLDSDESLSSRFLTVGLPLPLSVSTFVLRVTRSPVARAVER